MTETENNRDFLVRGLFEVRAEIKSLEEQEADILTALAFEAKKDRFASGPYLVSVTPTVRFNAELAEKVLTKKEFKSIQRPVPQSSLAKALYPDKYAAMQKTSGVSVKVGFDDE